MNYLDKIAYFREIQDPIKNKPQADKTKFEKMMEQRRKNVAELRNYRPLTNTIRGISFLGGFLPFLKKNPYLGIPVGATLAFLNGRIMDDITGRTKLKRELKYIDRAMDSYNEARQMFDDYNPAFQGSPWQTPRSGVNYPEFNT